MLPFSVLAQVVRTALAFGSLVYEVFDEFRAERKRNKRAKKDAR